MSVQSAVDAHVPSCWSRPGPAGVSWRRSPGLSLGLCREFESGSHPLSCGLGVSLLSLDVILRRHSKDVSTFSLSVCQMTLQLKLFDGCFSCIFLRRSVLC